MGVVVNSLHIAAPSFSGGQFLTLFHCSSMESLELETLLQEKPAPGWVLYGVTTPKRKPASGGAPFSMEPQVLPGTCSSMGFL